MAALWNPKEIETTCVPWKCAATKEGYENLRSLHEQKLLNVHSYLADAAENFHDELVAWFTSRSDM